ELLVRPPCRSLGVVLCTQEMQRDIWFITDHPTVVRQWRNIEDTAWREFDHWPTFHCRRGSSRNNHSNVFNFTQGRPRNWADMFRPFPSGFVGGSANGHAANPDHLEPALVKRANLIGILKSLQEYFEHLVLLCGSDRCDRIIGGSSTRRLPLYH